MNRITRGNERPANWAEFLLECGRSYRKRMRRGAGLGETSRRFSTTPEICQLALAFSSSPDLLKLRALIEDWTQDRISAELVRPHKLCASARGDKEKTAAL